MNKKGQNLRLALKGENDQAKKYIAGALTFDLEYQCETEESTSKDSTNGAKEFEAGMTSFSGSGECNLVAEAGTIAAHAGWSIRRMVGKKLEASFDDVDGDMNRETQRTHLYGDVIITSWKISAANKETMKASFSFQGTGELHEATIEGPQELTATTSNQTATYVAIDSAVITATPDPAATWLTASISNGVLTYKGSTPAATPRSAKVTLETANGGKLVVTINQAAAAA